MMQPVEKLTDINAEVYCFSGKCYCTVKSWMPRT